MADLNQLMVEYQNGNREAFRELLKGVSPRMFRFIGGTAGFDVADDLLQQTFLEVHKVRATYDPARPVLPWLFAIARHVCYRSLRDRARARARAAKLRVSEPPAPTDVEDVLALRDAVAGLPDGQRAVILLLKYGELSVDEVAAALGIAPGAVKQRAHRAYEQLRATLTDTAAEALGPAALEER